MGRGGPEIKGRAVCTGIERRDNMPIQRYTEMKTDRIREGAERRLGHTDNLMMTIINFKVDLSPNPTRRIPIPTSRSVISPRVRFSFSWKGSASDSPPATCSWCLRINRTRSNCLPNMFAWWIVSIPFARIFWSNRIITNFKPRKLLENAATPTSRVSAVLGGLEIFFQNSILISIEPYWRAIFGCMKKDIFP